MSIREKAKYWLKINHPAECAGQLRVSKYYAEKDIWFFTFPITYCESGKSGNLNILLQLEKEHDQFHYLKVPFQFFHANRNKLDVRESGDKFDLHISAKQLNWLVCERSQGVNFSKFLE
ncbi:MAG: hypothetical protein ABW148_18350 [Sedimenticola sp.]